MISIPITTYMRHQREKGKNKMSYFKCFIEKDNNIVFPSFPSGFYYCPGRGHCSTTSRMLTVLDAESK